MDLVELVGSNELKQDEWSLTAPTFGKDGQVKVVGWSSRNTRGEKLYIVKCSKCSEDSELFGEGYFKIRKCHLVKTKVLPCGCALRPRLTAKQYNTVCCRKSDEMGYKFLGFIGDWEGVYTKVKMLCEKHGDWCTNSIHSLLNWNQGCPKCGYESSAAMVRKPDEVMIDSFFSTGSFHPDTKFWRSDRKSREGYKTYWFMSCPECGETGESTSGNLQKGKRPCVCSNQRQREAYINLVIDENKLVVAVKFGISRDSEKRAVDQNRSSYYEILQHAIYKFPTTNSCKKAERECRQELECGVVLKRDMPDGYTETTYVYNLEKIIEIYERNGGRNKDVQ